MRTASIMVHLQQPIATIQPQLHGQFIEHLGTCIYDGIWVGERSSIANINGIRRSVVEALQQLHPPVIRWPEAVSLTAIIGRTGLDRATSVRCGWPIGGGWTRSSQTASGRTSFSTYADW